MVCDNFDIRPPEGSPNKSDAYRRRMVVPHTNEEMALTQQPASNNVQPSHGLEKMIHLMCTTQTPDMNPSILSQEDAVHTKNAELSLLLEHTCLFQGMASRALKKRSKIDVLEHYVPTTAQDLQCCRPQINSRGSPTNDAAQKDSSGLAHGVVRLDRSSGLPLGIRLDTTTGRIESVQWHGLVGAWNIDNPEQVLKARDRITVVNGHSSLDRIIAECSKMQELFIEVERAPKLVTPQRQWSIDVDRSSNEPLGIVVDSATSEITSVSWKGLIGAWNVDHPQHSVKPGDRLVQANGHSAADEIIAECKKGKKLHMVVERAPASMMAAKSQSR
jgi:hypothetical protein